MPTIRIGDDLMDVLRSRAEPFTDSPDSVLRRIFEEHGLLLQTANQRPAGSPGQGSNGVRPERPRNLTPQSLYELFLLHVLAADFKGKADKHHVTKAVISAMSARGYINQADMQRVSTGETKAENTIAWARNALKERHLISRTSPRGIWELTATGLKEGLASDLPTNA